MPFGASPVGDTTAQDATTTATAVSPLPFGVSPVGDEVLRLSVRFGGDVSIAFRRVARWRRGDVRKRHSRGGEVSIAFRRVARWRRHRRQHSSRQRIQVSIAFRRVARWRHKLWFKIGYREAESPLPFGASPVGDIGDLLRFRPGFPGLHCLSARRPLATLVGEGKLVLSGFGLHCLSARRPLATEGTSVFFPTDDMGLHCLSARRPLATSLGFKVSK